MNNIDQPRRPNGQFGHKIHGSNNVILTDSMMSPAQWRHEASLAAIELGAASANWDNALAAYHDAKEKSFRASSDAYLHDRPTFDEQSRQEFRAASRRANLAMKELDVARRNTREASLALKAAQERAYKADKALEDGNVAVVSAYHGPEHVDDKVRVEIDGKVRGLHRITDTIKPYEPQLIRVQVNRELSHSEAKHLHELAAYQYTTTGGGMMGEFVQDSPNSITIKVDTTHRRVEDKPVVTSRAYRQVDGRFSEGLQTIISEGSPIRKTNRAGEGTKGTRKIEALGDLKPEIYVDSVYEKKTPAN